MKLSIQHYSLLAIQLIVVAGPHLVGFVPTTITGAIVAYMGPPIAVLTTLLSILSPSPAVKS